MKALEYIDAIKAKHGVTSDYAVAKLLGIYPSKMSNWRAGRELPGALMCFKIAELLGDQPAAVIADIELERAERGEREGDASAWREMISKVSGGTLALALAVAAWSPTPAKATQHDDHCGPGSVYYVKYITPKQRHGLPL